MKNFIIKSFLFLLPLFLLSFFPSIVLYISGENFIDLRKVLKEDKGNTKFGYLYNEQNIGFIKWYKLTNSPKFKVLAMGTSRVLQIREEMFDSTFYNAGFTVRTTGDFLPFIKSIPKEKHPSILIIGLDQNMLNKEFKMMDKRNWANSFRRYPDQNILLNVYKDIFKGKYSLSDLLEESGKNSLGIYAKLGRIQFKRDGSTTSAGGFKKKVLFRDTTVSLSDLDPESFAGIENGDSRFAAYNYANDLAPSRVKELEELLNYCQENNIYVVAFITTMADEWYNKLIANGQYKILEKIYPELKPMFNRYNFELFNYSAPSFCNSNDNEMVDINHPTEKVHQKILIDMLTKKSKLSKVTNKERLESDLLKSVDRYTIY